MTQQVRIACCDDCTYKGRYSSAVTAVERAIGHAKRKNHRTRVLAENEDEQDIVYDHRPPTESGTDSVQ